MKNGVLKKLDRLPLADKASTQSLSRRLRTDHPEFFEELAGFLDGWHAGEYRDRLPSQASVVRFLLPQFQERKIETGKTAIKSFMEWRRENENA